MASGLIKYLSALYPKEVLHIVPKEGNVYKCVPLRSQVQTKEKGKQVNMWKETYSYRLPTYQ